jgi:hypothetical protein
MRVFMGTDPNELGSWAISGVKTEFENAANTLKVSSLMLL